jgi:predicted esterase
VLAYPGEFDRIIPAERVRAAAEAAQKDGLAVELREAKGQGHTLVVSAVLRECIEWLLARPSR